MFEFFFPFAVVSFLSFGLYLKGVVRVFFPLDLKGFLRFRLQEALSRPGRLPYKPYQVGAVLCLGCLLGSSVKPNSTASPS